MEWSVEHNNFYVKQLLSNFLPEERVTALTDSARADMLTRAFLVQVPPDIFVGEGLSLSMELRGWFALWFLIEDLIYILANTLELQT
jgi:hypothetical protein